MGKCKARDPFGFGFTSGAEKPPPEMANWKRPGYDWPNDGGIAQSHLLISRETWRAGPRALPSPAEFSQSGKESWSVSKYLSNIRRANLCLFLVSSQPFIFFSTSAPTFRTPLRTLHSCRPPLRIAFWTRVVGRDNSRQYRISFLRPLATFPTPITPTLPPTTARHPTP